MLFSAETSFISKFSTYFVDVSDLGSQTMQAVLENKWCCQWPQFNLSEFSSLSFYF